MSYIGLPPNLQIYKKASFAGDGVTTDFNLVDPVTSANSLLVIVNGTVQEPDVAYTIENAPFAVTLSFAAAPAGAANIYCIWLGSPNSDDIDLSTFLRDTEFADQEKGVGAWRAESSLFAVTAVIDSVVYWNDATAKYELADGTDALKGAVGIRNGANSIMSLGIWATSGLTPGASYYADASGGLTTTANDWFIGVALTATSLLVLAGVSAAVQKGGIPDGSVTPPKVQGAVNSQTGVSYTLVLSDAFKSVTMDNGSANTVTIPLNASVSFTVGDRIDIYMIGAGTTTVQGDTGVIINGISAGSIALTRYQAISVLKIETDTWLLTGGVVA